MAVGVSKRWADRTGQLIIMLLTWWGQVWLLFITCTFDKTIFGILNCMD